MIIVLGSIVADQTRSKQFAGSAWSMCTGRAAEPGCVAHAVHIDCENPLKLVFIEKWTDAATLAAHFKVKDRSHS